MSEKNKGKIVGTHTAPDPDAVAALALLEQAGVNLKESFLLFLREGNEEVANAIGGTLMVDSGQSEFDHHGRKENTTSAFLVAEKMKIEDKQVQQLLKLVRRNDLQGISLPFDLMDIIKCIQRNRDLTDKEKVELGVRLVKTALEFRRKKLQRNNRRTQEIVKEFLARKKGEIIPEKFLRYLAKLNDQKFERPFDFVSIVEASKVVSGEDESENLAKKLLEIIWTDSMNFYKAKEELSKAMRAEIRGVIIVAGSSENPKFNTAARNLGAAVIIQRKSTENKQIYFDTNTREATDELPEKIISMIRLEECLIRGREIPEVDLRRDGKIREVPEWYYFVAPTIGKKPPGRFILNGSLTAPDVPPSKIPLEILFYIAQCAVYYAKFNWMRWKTERIAYYMKKRAEEKNLLSPIFFT